VKTKQVKKTFGKRTKCAWESVIQRRSPQKLPTSILLFLDIFCFKYLEIPDSLFHYGLI